MNIEILFENDDMLAVNKPAGLVVHPDGKTEEPSLCDWIVEKYPEIRGVGEPIECKDGTIIERPGIVHRLDRDTSGVLVIAKNPVSYEILKAAFKKRKADKTYNAFVYGHVKEGRGTIDLPIGKSGGDFRKWSAMKKARGKIREAQTFFRVVDRGEFEGEKYSFLELKPKTGRTHQIRVHLQAKNHPVVSDHLYAPNKPKILGFERLALHSRKLEVWDQTIEAPYPDDFVEALL